MVDVKNAPESGERLTTAQLKTSRFGCRATGIENNSDLARLARERIRASAASDRMRVIESDAAGSIPDDATVVFLFLPAPDISSMLGNLMNVLLPGARVIAHEHSRIGTDIPPERRSLLAGEMSVTVASLWRV
ncbi:MAG TPA: class I SAM-dependent methyltransferase [Rhodothermales bacterium]|nr:class I SAM-dependent methyltransferase [Rhodothermales bacterium]